MNRLLLLIAPICLSVFTVNAQTLKPNENNINRCFEHSLKTGAAFDRCVQEEFERLRKEARPKSESEKESIALLKSGKLKNLTKYLDLHLERMQESRDRLYATPGSEFLSEYPSYFPSYYPRSYYPRYSPRIVYPRYYRYFPRSRFRY